jgi:hypothetical protein
MFRAAAGFVLLRRGGWKLVRLVQLYPWMAG